MEKQAKQRKPQGSQAKRWVFTLNNPEEGEILDPDLVDYSIVGDEVGEEGTRHFQGFAIFKKQQRISSLKKILPRAHWEVARGTNKQATDYCKKDGKFVEIGVLPKDNSYAVSGKRSRSEAENAVFTQALDSGSVMDGLAVIKQNLPRDYCLHGEAIERNLKRAKVEVFQKPYPIEAFCLAPLDFGNGKAVLLYGDTGTGKTCFALAHFQNPLVVSHIDGLKRLSVDNDAIVFDDMSFTHWPIESIIHLLDWELTREIHVRWGTVTIPRHTIKVFTHNTSNPFYHEAEKRVISDEQQAAVERRFRRVHVMNSLVDPNYVPVAHVVPDGIDQDPDYDLSDDLDMI